MDFEPCFKVYNVVSVHPKSLRLGQMTNLNVIFHVMVLVYQLVKIRNSPQFPAQFRNGLFHGYLISSLIFVKPLFNFSQGKCTEKAVFVLS